MTDKYNNDLTTPGRGVSPAEADIYDFDKTIVPFDSGTLFILYCVRRYPAVYFRTMPKWLYGLARYATVDKSMTLLKAYAFDFISSIPLEEAVRGFWDKYEKDVFFWAKPERRERYSVIITASPDFLIKEIAARLRFDDLISTKHDRETGAVVGRNVHDREKVRLFREKYPDTKVVNVYSDSIDHDKYIFTLAQKCYHIEKGRRVQFDFERKYS